MAIDAQGKDYASDQQLNIAKYRLLWTTLSSIRTAQMSNGGFTVDTDHMRILRVRDGGGRESSGVVMEGEGKRGEW